jgi:hypothetical protein
VSAVIDAAATGKALELLVALVELMVAYGRRIQPQRVHRLDGGLVVEGRGQQRAGAHDVTGCDGQ